MATNEIKEDTQDHSKTYDSEKQLSPQTKNSTTRKEKSASVKKDSRVVELDDEKGDEPIAVVISSENHDDALSGKKVRVTFHAQEGEDGDKPIFAGLNGYGYQIPRGDCVHIPVELLEIFENAKPEILTTEKGGVVKARNVNRFQYNVHGAVA